VQQIVNTISSQCNMRLLLPEATLNLTSAVASAACTLPTVLPWPP
jgi:hypothetical protein